MIEFINLYCLLIYTTINLWSFYLIDNHFKQYTSYHNDQMVPSTRYLTD